MQTLNITLPDDVQLSEKDALTALATRLYDTGSLSLEQAASVARYEVPAFIEELMGQSIVETRYAKPTPEGRAYKFF